MPRTHRCKDSDHIAKLADDYGFAEWQTIWDANPSLKSRRASPARLFCGDRNAQGDLVQIPDIGKKEAPGATEAHHVFVHKDPRVFLRIRILREDFTAIKDAQYTLTVPGLPDPFTGTTDGNGQFEHEIPRATTAATLTVRIPAKDSGPVTPGSGLNGDVPITWGLKVGALNPIMESAPDKWCAAGVQQRLNNLALNSGPIDGVRGAVTKAAVVAFQKLFKLDPDGLPGQGETQPKLVEVHDKPDSVLGPVPAP